MTPVVAVVGFMGAGKTSVGRSVARRLHVPFVDTDALIRRQFGPIDQIFATRGEKGFRSLERDAVVAALEGAREHGGVVSLGGGAVTIAEVRAALGRVDDVVWLDAPVERLYERAKSPRRPLTADEEQFRALYRERRPLYEGVATIPVRTHGREPFSVVVRRVEKALEARGHAAAAGSVRGVQVGESPVDRPVDGTKNVRVEPGRPDGGGRT